MFVVIAAALLSAAAPTQAVALPRLASINACTDQLLLALADPGQILGLSPYSRDVARGWGAAHAQHYRRLSGEAEDVLVLRPDIVVAGSFTSLATRTLLREQGLRVVSFDVADSIGEAKAQIRQTGALTQHPDRAAQAIARIDAALSRARQFVARKRYRVLPLSRRGWTPGDRSLMGSLLTEAGLANAAGDLGLPDGGFASLEAIINLRPDFILVSDDSDFAEDEGRAFLLHPALEHFYPRSRRLVIPGRLIECGGPAVADAMDRLVEQISRAERDSAGPVAAGAP